MNKRGRTLTDADVAFCLEQLSAGGAKDLSRLAFHVYGMSGQALSARLERAKSRGMVDCSHGHDPASGGWAHTPQLTISEQVVEYITKGRGRTAQGAATAVGISANWAAVLIRRACRRGELRCHKTYGRWGPYRYDAIVRTP